jgi:hypothetical protein
MWLIVKVVVTQTIKDICQIPEPRAVTIFQVQKLADTGVAWGVKISCIIIMLHVSMEVNGEKDKELSNKTRI